MVSECLVMGITIETWGLLQHSWTDRMWWKILVDMYIYACVGNWNDIAWIWLAKIHHHHLLRIILCFWAIRNSGSRVVYWCTIFCYYYIPQGSFIFGLILHMVFSYLFLFNTTVYGIFGPPYFQCLFMLVVSSMIAWPWTNSRTLYCMNFCK